MDAGPDIGSGLARLGRLPAALGPVVAMGAGEEADLRALRIAPLAMLGLDHDFKYAQDDKALTIDIPEWFADPAKRPNPSVCAFKIQSEGGSSSCASVG